MVRHRRLFDFQAIQGWYPCCAQKVASPKVPVMQAILGANAFAARLTCGFRAIPSA